MTPASLSPRRRRAIAAAVVVLAIGMGLGLLPALLASSKADDEDRDKAGNMLGPPVRVTVQNGFAVLTLSAAEQQDSGIETARARPAPAQETVAAYGSVLDPAPLAELRNRYLDAETQVQTALARLAVSRAAFERAKVLYKDQKNISAAQLQGAEGGFEVDKAALAAAQSRLSAVASRARQEWGSVLGAALIEGTPLVGRLIERTDYLVKVTLPPGTAVARPPETAIARLDGAGDRKSTRLNSSHIQKSRMPSSA